MSDMGILRLEPRTLLNMHHIKAVLEPLKYMIESLVNVLCVVTCVSHIIVSINCYVIKYMHHPGNCVNDFAFCNNFTL